MLYIFYVSDIVANKNNRICMENHNYTIEKKTRLERIGRFFSCSLCNDDII